MGLYKKILAVVLTLLISSCSLSGRNMSETDDLHTRSHPDEFNINIKLRRQDYNYEPWPYVKEIKCGWFYDEWWNGVYTTDGTEVCTHLCLELNRFEHRTYFYPTFESCLHHDYEVNKDGNLE